MPALPRAEATAPSVRELRLLPRPSGAGGGGGLKPRTPNPNEPSTQNLEPRSLRMIWIAVDAMGGDAAPQPVVDGAVAALRRHEVGVVLVGPAARLDAELSRCPGVDRDRIQIVDASDVVTMEDSPAAAPRREPDAPI